MTRQPTNRIITLVTMEELRQRYPEGSLEFHAAWFCGFRATSGERYCQVTLSGDGWTVEAPADIATLNRLNELGAREYMLCLRDDGIYLVTDGAEVLKAPEKPWHDGHEGNEDDYLSFVRENMKTVMDNARIPEGLQQKVLEIEGLKCEENTSEDRT